MIGVCQRLAAFLAIAGLLVAGCAVSTAVAADPETRQILAPSGKLRVGLYPGTPTSILPAPPSGEARGVGHDLGKELAQRLGVPVEMVVFAKNAEVLEAVKTGNIDIAFTNASPARARDMDFGPPYLEIELGYLVPQGSAVSTLADVDAKGIRVGVTEKSTSDATLSRDLKNAQIVRVVTINVAADLMAAGSSTPSRPTRRLCSRWRKKSPDRKCSTAAGVSSGTPSPSRRDATAAGHSCRSLPRT